MWPERSAAISAASSTEGPRPLFTTIAPRFIRASRAAFSQCRVPAPPGTCMDSMSIAPRNPSSVSCQIAPCSSSTGRRCTSR